MFVPSISTVKTNFATSEYLLPLISFANMTQQFLISAFDIARSRERGALVQLLRKARERGQIVMMDSGNYESYWKEEQESWKRSDFHSVIRDTPFSVAFSFDEQDPPDNIEAHFRIVIDGWHQDQECAGDRLIVPIVHGNSELLPSLCARIAEETGVQLIAVAERELGRGVIERAQTVLALRRALDEIGRYVGLHLLGTGSPISIALYGNAGADSFDGLEWFHTSIDHDSGLMFHLSQYDFFRFQTEWGEDDLPFEWRAFAHNLTFFEDWMQRLRRVIFNRGFITFCRLNFPRNIFEQCKNALDWE